MLDFFSTWPQNISLSLPLLSLSLSHSHQHDTPSKISTQLRSFLTWQVVLTDRQGALLEDRQF